MTDADIAEIRKLLAKLEPRSAVECSERDFDALYHACSALLAEREEMREGNAHLRAELQPWVDEALVAKARAALWKLLAKRLFAFRSLYRRTVGRPERLSVLRGKPVKAPLPCFANGCGCWKGGE